METSTSNYTQLFSSEIRYEVYIQLELKRYSLKQYLVRFKADLFVLQKELIINLNTKEEEEARKILNSCLIFYSGLFTRANQLKYSDKTLSKVLIGQKRVIVNLVNKLLGGDNVAFLTNDDKKKFSEINPELFPNFTNNEPKKENTLQISRRKLNWNGDKKVLIDIFHQLKNLHNKEGQALIPNSCEEVALFLINNFEEFSANEISTIRVQLAKKDNAEKSRNKIEIECKKD